MKKICIGVDTFSKIRSDNYLYIDKSALIEEIIEDSAQTIVFTRPRLTGKTLNLTMLYNFFDIKDAYTNHELFKGLYIQKSHAYVHHGSYPVIFIKNIGLIADSFENFLQSFRHYLSLLFLEFEYLIKDLDQTETAFFEKVILNEYLTQGEIIQVLPRLRDILYRYYSKKVVVLIDAFDSPLHKAYTHGYYKELAEFFNTLYSMLLNDSIKIKKAIITGRVNPQIHGVFLNINNLKEYTILDLKYSQYFGFTDTEVKEALAEYKLSDQLHNIVKWYQSTDFYNVSLYNPWSIINYLKSREFISHWLKTAEHSLIYDFVQKSNLKTLRKLCKLTLGQSIKLDLSKFTDSNSYSIQDNIFVLLLYTGYLTVDKHISDSTYKLKIPNNEILIFFKRICSKIIFKNTDSKGTLTDSLDLNNRYYIGSILQIALKNALKLKKNKRNSKPGKIFIKTLDFQLHNIYDLKYNYEVKKDLAFILLKGCNDNKHNYIFILKRVHRISQAMATRSVHLRLIDDSHTQSFLSTLKVSCDNRLSVMALIFDNNEVVSFY